MGRTGVLCVVLVAVAALAAPPALAEEVVYEGPVLGGRCTFAVTAGDDGRSYRAALGCEGDGLTVAATGGYAGDTVRVEKLTVALGGLSRTWVLGRSYTLPVDLEDTAQRAAGWARFGELLFGDAEQIGIAASRVTERLGRLPDAPDPQALVDRWERYCEEEVNADNPLCQNGLRGLMENPTEQDANSACPIYKPMAEWTFVCIPTVVYGSWKTPADRPNLLVLPPFGVLLVVPLDVDQQDPTTAKMTATGSFSVAGGAITGGSLSVKAREIGFTGAAVGTFGTLTLNAPDGKLRLGRATTPLKFPLPQIPATVWARTVKGTSAAVDVGKGSTLSVSGGGELGGQGGADGAQRAGGGTQGWAGSHGGIGGFRFTGHHIPDWPSRADAAWGNPFDPAQPGHAGAGTVLGGAGGNGTAGGGVIRLTTGGELRVDGTVAADGLDQGPLAAEGGGSGSGGSVNLRGRSFIGKGTVSADGGDGCAYGPDPSIGNQLAGCGGGTDSLGGSGGGGRIAVRAKVNTFKGKVLARGGREQAPPGSNATNSSSGGAGTVFWLDTDATVQPKEGKLVVEGAGQAVPAGETPLRDEWSSKQRDLVVGKGARVLARTLRFRNLDVQSGGAILSGPARARIANGAPDDQWQAHSWDEFCSGFCGGGERLTVVAENRLRVAGSARIDVSGRGLQGGRVSADRGATAGERPGGAGSTWGYGGSHGGKGGAASAGGGTAGATYDSTTNPTQPGAGGGGDDKAAGAPGGGLLRVEASRLELSGRLLADGGHAGAPTRAEPFTRWWLDGAGAGGSIVVTVRDLAGSGAIRAAGGNACLPAAWLWSGMHDELPDCEGSGDPEGNGGAGGGGRVSVCVLRSRSSWRGTLGARGGRDVGHDQDAKGRPGTDGTTLLRKAKAGASRC